MSDTRHAKLLVSDTQHTQVLQLEHLLFLPTGILLFFSYLVHMHALAVVVLAVGAGIAMGMDGLGLIMGALLRRFLQLVLVFSSYFWLLFGCRRTSYFYVPQLDLTTYSPWWVILWPLFFWLSGQGLTALVVVCGSFGLYTQQDFLLKIAFSAFCVLLVQHADIQTYFGAGVSARAACAGAERSGPRPADHARRGEGFGVGC